jgi:hypothetical protein
VISMVGMTFEATADNETAHLATLRHYRVLCARWAEARTGSFGGCGADQAWYYARVASDDLTILLPIQALVGNVVPYQAPAPKAERTPSSAEPKRSRSQRN